MCRTLVNNLTGSQRELNEKSTDGIGSFVVDESWIHDSDINESIVHSRGKLLVIYLFVGKEGKKERGKLSFPSCRNYFWNNLFQFLYSLSFQGPLW